MDFELSADDVALVEGIASFCAGRFPMETVRSLAEDGGVRPGLWTALADTGVFGVRIPEVDGGVGLGMAEAVLIFEELGRALVPGPIIATHCTTMLEGFPGEGEGDSENSGAGERDSESAAHNVARLAKAAANGTSVFTMVERDRRPILIENLGAADFVLAVGPGGIDIIEAGTIDARPAAPSFDPLTPVWVADGLPSGQRVGGVDAAKQFTLEAAALSAAMLSGIALRTVELGVAYAKERRQFDRPIGSFQAVKHLLADAVTKAEVARAAVHAAGVTLDDPVVGDPARAVAGAKLLAGETAIANARTCIQVHGGMGFTWEVDAHLYLKRAMVLSSAWGTPDEQAEALAEAV